VKLHLKQNHSAHRPSAILKSLGRLRAWKQQLVQNLRHRNLPAETTAHSVVSSPVSAKQTWLAPTERKLLLELARTGLINGLNGNTSPGFPELPAKLLEERACFVTLTQGGLLRGCMGNLLPRAPLYQTVIENTCNAALRDPRFPPVQEDDLAEVQIEISVLSELQPLRFHSVDDLLHQLQPGVHGVFLQVGTRIATFLPQVWEQVPDQIKFLDRLAQKCGCPPSAWRQKDAQLSIYQAESFRELDTSSAQN
jgi:AmmeMemoRadiSam system protein A